MSTGRCANQIVWCGRRRIQSQRANFRIALRGVQRGVCAQLDPVNADSTRYLRLVRGGSQSMEIINCRGHVITFDGAKQTPAYQRLFSVSAQIGPEYGEVCALVYFYGEVQEPRAISPVMMQENYRGRSFCALN